MPATEQTWRNQHKLHVWFGVTSVLLLISTLWMFVKDHNRPWKTYQRNMRTIERRVGTWRLQQEQSTDKLREQRQLEEQLRIVRSNAPDPALLQAFTDTVLETGIDDAYIPRIEAATERLNSLAAEAASKRDVFAGQVEELNAARGKLADARLAGQDDSSQTADVESLEQQLNALLDQHAETAGEVAETEQSAVDARQDLLAVLAKVIDLAQRREESAGSKRKFQGADFDEARSKYNLAVRDNLDEQTIQDPLLADSLGAREKLSDLTVTYQQASAYRIALQTLLTKMRDAPAVIEKQLADARADAKRIRGTLDDRTSTYFMGQFPFLGKRWLELPVLDAFNSPLKIDNLWTKDLLIPYGSFGEVRRFDRCTTCHQSIDKTMPGRPSDGAYVSAQELVIRVTAPDDLEPEPASELDQDVDSAQDQDPLERLFGIVLAERGLVAPEDVTVQYVRPESAAAAAEVVGEQSGSTEGILDGLQAGDVIRYIGQDRITQPKQVRQFLVDNVQPEQDLLLTVRRGMPSPYASHPRLDLFVGSLSPHPKSRLGCTVCHEGQGSGTAFQWASHSPNTPNQGMKWFRDYGWFNNHHWIYPMYPKRFAESSCLKCHHEVVELEPSERFPEAPAPKLTEGHQLIASYGCFGCHEINGYRGDQRIGPDLRLEPNYFAAAAQLSQDPAYEELPPEVQQWAATVRHKPEDDESRQALFRFVSEDAQSEEPTLTAASHKLKDVLDDIDFPGKLRKTGPSLRHVGHKLGKKFLYDWIRDPKDFRPSTRMPKFFGQWDHLVDEESRAIAEKFEPIEILGTVQYLLARTQSYNAGAKSETETAWDEDAVTRGRRAFELRGCLACHAHSEFPEAKANQGPDLSNIGDKLAQDDNPDTQKWLYNWLKHPSNYHARTKMPDLQLNPTKDANGTLVDPAADIAAYLLSSKQGWQPSSESLRALTLDESGQTALDELVSEYLNKAYFRLEAEQFIQNGVPADRARGAELELVVADGASGVSVEQKLLYVGNKTIGKYGCYGCHDIPGFETAKPIGAALASWGRKESSKIAFEHINEYLEHGHGGHGNAEHGNHGQPDSHASSDEDGHDDDAEPFDDSYYHEKLHEHDRAGFIWQKLTEPRSYDFRMTANKDYNERLRMPLFPFSPEQREAVITFVLGLVAEPPADEFVYHPDPRNEALIAGRKVIQKYNCTGCHVIEPEKWELEFADGDVLPAPVEASYPFVDSHFTVDQRKAASTADKQRGTLQATVVGMPDRDQQTALPVFWDEEEEPLEPEDLESGEYDPSTLIQRFQLWEPLLLGEEVAEISPTALSVPTRNIRKKHAPWGGDLTLLLLPKVLEYEREVNPEANGKEAWAWLPPPLIGQGNKTQTDWLHDFLLDPHMIRPATVMRMPKFNMSSQEATDLVNFFAARDQAEYPYTFASRTRRAHLQRAEDDYQQALDGADVKPVGDSRLEHAMGIVTNNNYCIKCHGVGDYEPNASPRAKAPNLSEVYRRLRPEYVRDWIAEPRRILPYTAMPVNIPFNPDAPNQGGIAQNLFHGTSTEQLDGLVDLLMNYNIYAEQRAKIAPLVKENSPPARDAAAETGPSAPTTEPSQDVGG